MIKGNLFVWTKWQLDYIEREFSNNGAIKRLLEFFYEQPWGLGYTVSNGEPKQTAVDARDKLFRFVEDMMLQMVNMAYVYVEACNVKRLQTVPAFNTRVGERLGYTKSKFPMDKMAKKYKAFAKTGPGKLAIQEVFDHYLGGYEPMFKEFYIRTADAWFQKGFKGRKLANTIIDFINLGIVEEVRGLNMIYMTEEKKPFVKLIRKSNDERYEATNRFYDKFYHG